MLLSNTFTVDLALEDAWATFLDLERIAPCLPGAAITEVDGNDFHGGVKIKVGPITAQYHGIATFVEADESAHRAIISAKGRDVSGSGNADATITAVLSPQGTGTQVLIETELELSGRMAQFGRGVISDVSGRIITQFARNLEAEILRGVASDASAENGTAAQASRPRPSLDDVEALDVLGGVRGLLRNYAVPAVGGAALLALGVAAMRRSSQRTPSNQAPMVTILLLHSGEGTWLPATDILERVRR